MIRTVLYLLLSVLALALLRSVIGLVMKAFSQLLQPTQPDSSGGGASGGGSVGELMQDPVCGVFVPSATSTKKTVGGKLYHFCSANCRDKFTQS